MRERVSKRILGFIAAIVGLTLAVLSGLDWYEINNMTIGTVLAFSTALLGIDTHYKSGKNE